MTTYLALVINRKGVLLQSAGNHLCRDLHAHDGDESPHKPLELRLIVWFVAGSWRRRLSPGHVLKDVPQPAYQLHEAGVPCAVGTLKISRFEARADSANAVGNSAEHAR